MKEIVFPQDFLKDKDFITFNFFQDNKCVKNSPVCGMTLKQAGSMRFRWNEENPVRSNMLKKIADSNSSGKSHTQVPLELIHSHIVYPVLTAADTYQKQGDGIITQNRTLMPVVTVADCMPVYVYDPVQQVFGVLHSGWKGTGIVCDAIKLAAEKYGSNPKDFCIILGPHIRDCCYIVNEERAAFFAKNFTPQCVQELEEGGNCYAGGRGLAVNWNNGGGKLYRLSLEKANLAAIKNAGVPEENVTVVRECTCCNQAMGSNRRETSEAPDNADKTRCFTVQAAFIKF